MSRINWRTEREYARSLVGSRSDIRCQNHSLAWSRERISSRERCPMPHVYYSSSKTRRTSTMARQPSRSAASRPASSSYTSTCYLARRERSRAHLGPQLYAWRVLRDHVVPVSLVLELRLTAKLNFISFQRSYVSSSIANPDQHLLLSLDCKSAHIPCSMRIYSCSYASDSTQYTDGITGALIVHPSAAPPPTFPTWDQELVVQMADLYHTFSSVLLDAYLSVSFRFSSYFTRPSDWYTAFRHRWHPGRRTCSRRWSASAPSSFSAASCSPLV